MKDSESVTSSKALLKALWSYDADKSGDVLLEDTIERLGVEGRQLGRCAIGTQDVWIVKEVGSSCGRGITLCSSIRELFECVRDMNFKCIVQKYIERPLLLRTSRKFDIRQWVLVTSLQPLKVFGFSEFYCRLSNQTYRLDDSLDNMAIHLCNYAVQAAEDGTAGDDTMCTQEELSRHLAGLSPAVSLTNTILPQIKQISLDAVASAAPSLTEVGKGFEWLGLDLVVSDAMDVYLIEVNVSPDVSRSTPLTSRLVEAATKGLYDLLLSNESEEPTEGETQGDRPKWEIWSATHGLQPRSGVGVINPAKLRSLDKDYTAKKQHVYDRAMAWLGEPGTELKQGREALAPSLSMGRRENSEEDEDEL